MGGGQLLSRLDAQYLRVVVAAASSTSHAVVQVHHEKMFVEST
jgi:hypothetical protein